MTKKQLPSKECVYQQVRATEMSSAAQAIILCMVDNAWFTHCIIVKQLMAALDLSEAVVEKSLVELTNIGLVKQQALFGNERTYVVNSHHFSTNQPPRGAVIAETNNAMPTAEHGERSHIPSRSDLEEELFAWRSKFPNLKYEFFNIVEK